MKLGFVSLGCPKNLVDSEVMLGHLTRSGYELTVRAEEAEVIVVNTCGFIDKAKKESIDTILEMARFKEKGSLRRLVVTGCLAQRYAAELSREIPEIDVLVGLDQVESIREAVEGDLGSMENLRADGSVAYLYDDLSPRLRTTPGFSAYVKISEGCDYPCTFCIIPKIRGHYRSRTPDSILKEAEALGSSGVRELVLVAQDTTRYGVDLGQRSGLASLLRQLARVPGIEWVRFLYAYPTTLSDDVFQALADEPRLCRYLDMPLQHASDAILKAMKRPGTGKSNRELVARARAAVPGLTVRTSFIVGFPGETDEDFEALVRFCREVEFDRVGVFTYSNEEDTEAFVAEETVSAEEKRRRRRLLLKTQAAISLRKNRALVGSRLPVLVEGASSETEHLLQGRTEGQAPEIDGHVLINDGMAYPGSLVTVRVTEAHPHDVVGRIVETGNEPATPREGHVRAT